jgi:tetratricopeptide (TPR) repeat protein
MNGLIVDLDEAVDLTLEAARMTKGIYIPLIHSLPNISIILDESFKETAATKHLIGKSIETAGMGEARARGYYFLSCFLQHRSEQTRSLLDLEKAITATRQSVDCTDLIAENRSNLRQRLGQVARGVLARFEKVDDLNQAIASSIEAVDLIPEPDADRAIYLNTLGNALQRRFEANGNIDDLNKAIDMVHESISCDRDPFNYVTLGVGLFRRFTQTGSRGDLTDAIEASEQALNLVSVQQPFRLEMLNNLGLSYSHDRRSLAEWAT